MQKPDTSMASIATATNRPTIWATINPAIAARKIDAT